MEFEAIYKCFFRKVVIDTVNHINIGSKQLEAELPDRVENVPHSDNIKIHLFSQKKSYTYFIYYYRYYNFIY